MSEETAVQQELQSKFPRLEGKIRIVRARRIFVIAPAEDFAEVFDYVVRKMNFCVLCTITGLDLGQTLGAYHVARDSGIVLNIQIELPKSAPVVASVMPYFASAEVYEREMVDLLGMDVRGLPPGSRYPLPDDWPKEAYPLRKDFNPNVLEKEARSNG